MKKLRRILKQIAEAYKETLAMQAGKIKYKTYSSFSEMEKDLDSERYSELGIKKADL